MTLVMQLHSAEKADTNNVRAQLQQCNRQYMQKPIDFAAMEELYQKMLGLVIHDSNDDEKAIMASHKNAWYWPETRRIIRKLPLSKLKLGVEIAGQSKVEYWHSRYDALQFQQERLKNSLRVNVACNGAKKRKRSCLEMGS